MTAAPPRSHAVADVVGTSRVHDLWVMHGFEDILRANGLDSLEALFAARGAEPLNKPGLDAWRHRARVTLSYGGTNHVYYLKRYHDPPASARRDIARSGITAFSLAGKEWRSIAELRRAKIPCVEAVAFGEELRRGREIRSAILTRAAGGQSLERWCGANPSPSAPTARRLLLATADLVRQLHAEGLVHRDLYLAHVFYDPDAQDEHGLLRLIDLQRLKRPGRFLARWIVKDLAALNYSTPAQSATRADRARWLKAYLGIDCLPHAARRLIYQIVGKTSRIARHDARRAQRLGSPEGPG